jgi:AraC family transcriptional regulator
MSSAELRPQHGVADAPLEHMILSDVEHGCPAGPLFGESLIQVLAAYALRRYGVGGPQQQLLHRGGLTPMQLRRVRDYIEANLHRTLHVSDLATVTGLSSYHFGKMFKLSTGQSVHKFVLNRRLARASDFLQNDDLPISYIGHLVGLPNQSHFTKVFRDRTSMTPRSWRVAGYKPLD